MSNSPKPNRAIDRHEDAICEVLDLVDRVEDMTYDYALQMTAARWHLSTERLDSLLRTWCAIAGIEVPA